MRNYQDIGATEHGEFIIGPTGDITRISKSSAAQQMIEHRLQTVLGDLYCHPQLGQNLDQLIGKRLTMERIEQGKLIIHRALMYDSLLALQDISITAVPTSPSTVIYHVTINIERGADYTLDLYLDINKGIRRI